MKILITGGEGLVGGIACRQWKDAENVACPPEAEFDITDRKGTFRIVGDAKPDVVLHCGALTDVDRCEQEPGKAYLVNGLGTHNVALACREARATLIFFSTDFVFDGGKGCPYAEMDVPSPLSVYGKSKLLGEYYASHLAERFLIVRTSRIFGPGGRNFASRLPEILRREKKVVLDTSCVNSPTYVFDLVAAVKFLIDSGICGIVNVCNRGACSWLELGRCMAGLLNVKAELIGREFATEEQAPRPKYSVLSTELLKSYGYEMPVWEDAIDRFLKQPA